MKPSRHQDTEHLRMGYALLKEALDELQQVYRKDNTLAHMVRTMGAMEDTLYEYISNPKQRRAQ